MKMTRTTSVDDIVSGETKDFVFTAKKCEDHEWSGCSGIAWIEYLEVDITNKTSDKAATKSSSRVTTRDNYDAKYDLRDRWSYDYVKVNVLDNDKNIIEVIAVDREGKPYTTRPDAFYMKLKLDEIVK